VDAQMRKCQRIILAAWVVVGGATAAQATDIRGLAEFVRPAYTAMNFALLCARESPFFLADASGPRGTALHYAEHVKDEAIDGLSQDEAVAVLRSAADAARSESRRELYRLAQPGDDSATSLAIRDWCDSKAKKFVLDFIRQHDAEHLQTLEFLRRAKQ
jgi:hypothetical protein